MFCNVEFYFSSSAIRLKQNLVIYWKYGLQVVFVFCTTVKWKVVDSRNGLLLSWIFSSKVSINRPRSISASYPIVTAHLLHGIASCPSWI